ncbi:MAG: hypothetical protein ABR981_04075 [Candidatus Micrarchaeaceae archaeon]|jgi:hypothetical protein
MAVKELAESKKRNPIIEFPEGVMLSHINDSRTARWAERQIFPERLWSTGSIEPSRHIENGLLARPQIEHLLRDKSVTVLSVNSGKRYFETLLVKGYGISPHQITVAGDDPFGNKEPSVVSRFGDVVKMDMFQKNWPLEGRHYDYVLVAGLGSVQERIVENALCLTGANGQLRYDFHGLHGRVKNVLGRTLVYEKEIKFFEDLKKKLEKEYSPMAVDYDEDLLIIERGTSSKDINLLPERSVARLRKEGY